MIFLKYILSSIFITSLGYAASLNLGTWNVANNPTTPTDDGYFNTVISEMGRFSILGVNEINTASSLRFRNLVNSNFGVSSYQHEISSAAGGDRVGYIYDTSQVTLLSSTEINDVSLTRPIYRGLFSPIGTASTADDFYFYSAHLKSGSAGADITQRGIEAGILRSNISALGASANYIVSGDLNLTGASEVAWGNLTAGGLGELVDPAGASGEWRDNSDYLSLHSQDPSASMDDRFDFVLASPSFLYGNPFQFIPSSYNTLGNDGTHTLNGMITTGSGDPALLTALTMASDHLPVFASFSIGVIASPEPSSGVLILFAVWVVMMIRRYQEYKPIPEYTDAQIAYHKVKDVLSIYDCD